MASYRCFIKAIVFIAGLTSSKVYGAFHSKMSGVQNDISDITWAHAVNSWEFLEKALASPVDFLEADISLGHVVGYEDGPAVPVMAHPPDSTSDISLDSWLGLVLKRKSQKGLKLDFKSLEVVEPSLVILEKYASKLNGSLWLSADVLPGPVSPGSTPLQSDLFLALCYRFFPSATISLGWTTNWNRRYSTSSWKYDWKHVRQMADAVRCWFKDKHPSITFSVRAIYATRSTKQLNWLLKVIPGSTLLVWSGNGDFVNVEEIKHIQKSFPKGKVYYNLPETLYNPYKKAKEKSVSTKKLDSSSWLTVTRDKICEGFTYIDESIILFGKTSDSVVFQKNLIPVDGSKNFTMSGRLKFFAGDHTINPVHWEHKLEIVFSDVSKISKHALSYSKKKLTYSVSDSKSLWSAVNSSVVYTFEHQYFQDRTACRMFKIEFKSNLSFEAWTIPCDETFDDNSYEEVSKSSISEVYLQETFEKEDGIYMVGFHSFGEEYVLVYDLDINSSENKRETVLDLPKLQLALTSSKAKLKEDLVLIVASFLTASLTFLHLFVFNDVIVKNVNMI